MEPSVKREVKEFIQNKFSSQFLILHFSSHPAAPAALGLWRRNFSENSRVPRCAGVFGTQNFFRVYFVPRGAPPFKIGSEGKVFLREPVRIYLKRDLVHFFFVYSFGSEQFQKSQHRHSMIAVGAKFSAPPYLGSTIGPLSRISFLFPSPSAQKRLRRKAEFSEVIFIFPLLALSRNCRSFSLKPPRPA